MEDSMSFLGQMKRRNVFRIGMAYIVAAWVLVQMMDIIAQNFMAPDWVMKLLVFFCFAGFPFALWLSWAYEITPDGLRKEIHVDRTLEPHPEKGKKLDVFIMAMLAVVVGLVSLERFMPKAPELAIQPKVMVVEPDPIPTGPILENSIAVLPFVNMSADPNQDYFSDGLSEELLNVLTHVEGLNVASRTSSFAYKGSTGSIQQIARSLRVANILEGSVRKVGNRLRITAQLIDADTDVHLWSDSYDRDMTDIFQIQDEIANAIVSALTVELGVGLQAVTVKSATSNLDAYDLYLQGRELFIARKNLPTSWALLDQAVHMDPEFARAWETLSAVRSVATSWFPGSETDHDSLALAAARRALEIDPSLSMPHAVIGMKFELTGEGYAGAIASLDKAIENDPKNATASLWRGILFKDMGYIEESRQGFEQCLEIDPGYLLCSQYLALSLLTLGEIESAIKQFELTFEDNFHGLDDNFVSYYVHTGQRNMAFLVAAHGMTRAYAPIKDWIEAIENPNQDHSSKVARFNKWGEAENMTVCEMNSVAVSLKQEQCFQDIENAGSIWHPDAAWYRKKPAFKEYVNEHLMAYWQENGFPPQCHSLDDGDFECD